MAIRQRRESPALSLTSTHVILPRAFCDATIVNVSGICLLPYGKTKSRVLRRSLQIQSVSLRVNPISAWICLHNLGLC